MDAQKMTVLSGLKRKLKVARRGWLLGRVRGESAQGARHPSATPQCVLGRDP